MLTAETYEAIGRAAISDQNGACEVRTCSTCGREYPDWSISSFLNCINCRNFKVGELDDKSPENREALQALVACLRLGYRLRLRSCVIDPDHSTKTVTIQARH